MLHGFERRNLRGVRAGEREACEALVCEHYEGIYRFLAYLSGDGALAEDLTQEVFAVVWVKIESFRGRGSVGGWMHKIAYNKFIDWKRSDKRQGRLVDKWKEENGGVSIQDEPFLQLMANEDSRLLCDAMHKLDATEYVVVLLHYVQGLSFREMARILDEPVGTVKWRTNKALSELRDLLIGRIEK